MISGKRLVVVMPAYNAEKTLRMTYSDLPMEYVDEVVLVDDASRDNTAVVAAELGIRTIVHSVNGGYGANQKTCYHAAMELDADIIVMVHPDYQYSPRLVTAMASMIVSGHYDVVLGSRILGGEALRGGMPYYKYLSNRVLTAFENIIFGIKLSEYHTGFRAFSRKVIEKLPLELNSDDFLFDNEMLAQSVAFEFRIGEISCPTKYFPEASSISFWPSVRYGFGVINTAIKYFLHRNNLKRYKLFSSDPELIL
ncbi:MAG: glycosyltransferase family 2 protein [Desulfuromonadaceae bacterium]|nr:glycosyltransferase family 2 protein [Desulfuromonadaceae bacterium]MDD2856718.1 glycosyltransferase family 2 protein [Desulfuromonadaceae bacterium]